MYCIYGWLQHCIAVVFATTKHPDSTWKLLVSEHIVRKELGLLYACCLWGHVLICIAGRISSLEDEARQQRQALSKAEADKRQLQEKLTDLEKVYQKI